MSTIEATRSIPEPPRDLLSALIALCKGHSSTRLSDSGSIPKEVVDAFNELAAYVETLTSRLEQTESIALLASELKEQQTELIEANQILEMQAKSLIESEALLKAQQDELHKINDDLHNRARLLSEQNRQVERRNREIERERLSLEEKARTLAITSRYKSEFLTNMSHELRTPLNSLLILAKLLYENAENNLSEKQVEFARTIYISGSDLLNLINEILDLSKIESGTITLDLSEVFLEDVAEALKGEFAEVASQKNLDFLVLPGSDLPPSIYTDDKRLHQILRNLIGNAIKFTSAGSVELLIYRAESGWSQEEEVLNESGHVIAFSVADTGIGIQADKHQMIFAAFHQADGTTSRKFGGTGLGLSICRELSSILGGEITLESEVGRGSRFTLYLPKTHMAQTVHKHRSGSLRAVEFRPQSLLRAGRLKKRVETSGGANDFVLDGQRVFIVDDDVRNIFALTSVLENYGMDISYADTGRGALDELKRDPDFSVVLIDIMLPEMDGYEVIRRIREDSRFQDLPVIALTARAMTGDREKCLAAGASDYLAKPVDPDELISLLRDWLEDKA